MPNRSRLLSSLLTLLCAALWFSGSLLASGVECGQVLEKLTFDFKGKKVRVSKPARKELLSLESVLGSDPGVFLGITRDGHWYFLAGKTRVEGAFLPIPSFKFNNGFYSNGYLIRFPHVPKEKVERWVEKMRGKSSFRGFSFSCAQTACSALRKGFGIRVAGSTGVNILTNTTFRRILEKGFEDKEGRAVPVEIYSTDPKVRAPEKLYDYLIDQDIKYSLVSAAVTLGGPVLLFIAAATGVPNDDKKKARKEKQETD